jgi:hypothetical protein
MRRVNDDLPTPHGTQRRLQALVARWWSPQAISQATGMRAPQLARALESRQCITPALAAAVRDAYDQLWDQCPPMSTNEQRDLAQAAGELGRLRGWAPPLAWDDDQIDRPDARPVDGWRPSARGTHRSADIVEDAEFVRAEGGCRDASLNVIAVRLGVNEEQLRKALSRHRSADPGGSQLEPG